MLAANEFRVFGEGSSYWIIANGTNAASLSNAFLPTSWRNSTYGSSSIKLLFAKLSSRAIYTIGISTNEPIYYFAPTIYS
jgi:hypothetical protein